MALNNKQQKALELLIYSPYMTQQMIAKEVGVHRDTIRVWKEENQEFKAALEKGIKDRWKSAEAMAVNGMIALAQEGNFQAIRYMLDNLGYKPVEKIEADINSEINIVIEE